VEQYRVEEAQQTVEVERLNAAGAEAHDVKQARAVLQETRNMIPITLEELRSAARLLRDSLDEAEMYLAGDASLAALPSTVLLLEDAHRTLSRPEP
jgi:Tubulin binding cofactor A